jgi:spermidine dehydrogenase
MSHSRREFIKYVVVGSVAAGCPIDHTLLATPDSAPVTPRMDGEHFEVCHQVRDGHKFERPSPTKKAAVVIIGGGVAGLSAGYFLGDQDWLLLEKEDHFGGNAYQESYDGQPFATGSAFAYRGDDGDRLAAELGLKLLPVDNPDPTIVNKTFVPDTWNTGLDQLPYAKAVIASFKKFRDKVMKLDLNASMNELDAQSFAKYTAGHAPEVQQWWDGFGPSNWGCITEDTSALLGADALQGMVTGFDARRVILPGGLGCITHRLVETMLPKYQERMLGEATVVAVVPMADGVNVTYLHGGELTTVSAKAAIMCVAKYISARLITELPAEQISAMHQTRYAPYPVVNLIFDKPVYNRGYDNWCPGNTFTDFIVADWTIRKTPGYVQKNNILSCYTPLREYQRSMLLREEDCKMLAAKVLADVQKLLPETNVNPVEVCIYRRGHPMFMGVPGQFTKNRLVAAQPLERIYFGNADSSGPESLTSESVRLSRVAADWCSLVLGGKPGGKELANKALRAVSL